MIGKGERALANEVIGKTVVSKAGKTFGQVGDLIFETRTGELIYLLLKGATGHADSFDIEKDSNGVPQVPFSAVMAIGDFVVIAEEDLV